MKKISLLVAICFLVKASLAQIVFREDFDGVDGPTAAGAGTYLFPPGWRLSNVDNNTPDAQVAYVNNAWTRRDNFINNIADSCAFSTSYYSPAGTANDFMWTPLIGSLPPHCVLSWRAMAADPLYPDGYEVRIMTVAPTGGTGVIGNQLTNSTVLFSTAAESAGWVTRTVSLNAYAGQNVYIGFRNNSTDQFLLLIDDVKVEVVITNDAQVISYNTYEYAQYPLSQVVSFPLSATIRNNGLHALTNVSLRADIYNSGGALVHTQTGIAQASLPSNASMQTILLPWTPTATGSYTIKYCPVHDSADMVPGNDTLYSPLIITDGVYARDDGNITGSIGLGTGNGYLGQTFTLSSVADLRSITVTYLWGYAGRKYGLAIWNTNAAGIPNAIIAATDTLLYPDDNFLTDTIPIYGGKITLTPGTYAVTAIEFDSTIALCWTNDIFTPGKIWYKYNNLPWDNVENAGSVFKRPYYIRMNISSQLLVPLKLVSFTGHPVSAGNKLEWVVAEQENIKAYEIERSSNGKDFKKIGVVPASTLYSYHYDFTDTEIMYGAVYYRLKIVEDNQLTYSKMIRIQPSGNTTVNLSPNPVKKFFTLQSTNRQLLHTDAGIFTANGQLITRFRITSLPFSMDTGDWLPGIYFLRLYDNSVIKVVKQ